MSTLRGRLLPLAVLTAAAAALIASIVWVAANAPTSRPGSPTMMGAVSGGGRVHNLADADRAAGGFADRWDLRVGEIMQFSNGYYAELLDPNGDRATEVLIDPGSGSVRLEYGPAMMWNTLYGMMHARGQPGVAAVVPEQAVRIADQWLQENRPDMHAAEPDRFPGYYTLHTLRGDHLVGMLSVNARTGAVWYHTWHGKFLQMQDA